MTWMLVCWLVTFDGGATRLDHAGPFATRALCERAAAESRLVDDSALRLWACERRPGALALAAV